VSPKDHTQLVTVPELRSLKATVRGAEPAVGVPEKSAVGACALSVEVEARARKRQISGVRMPFEGLNMALLVENCSGVLACLDSRQNSRIGGKNRPW